MQENQYRPWKKIVSIFESHTDIIHKDRRDTYYGHKICLTGGASNLILDCVVLEGNPADSDLTEMMLDRQKQVYGRYPLKATFDGCFASKENQARAREKEGLKDICFSKRRGLAIEDMCRSNWVYKQLRNFRAGIESGISWIKRRLGLDRCTWKGFASFKSYVWASIISQPADTCPVSNWPGLSPELRNDTAQERCAFFRKERPWEEKSWVCDLMKENFLWKGHCMGINIG